MFFWHLGATVGFIRYAFRDERMDLRFLMAGAVLANFIDTPIGFAFWDELQNVRLFTHTLLVVSAIMVFVLVTTRRGRPRKRWMPLAIGMLMQLFLDAMWQEPDTLWWPFLGWEFSSTGFATVGEYVGSVLKDWRMWALEVLGFAYLVYLAKRSGLGDPDKRKVFLTKGIVSAPIDRR